MSQDCSTHPLVESHGGSVTVAAAGVERDEGLESGTIPVIELPSTEYVARKSSFASNRNDDSVTPTVKCAIEPPREGVISTEDLEASAIATLLVEDNLVGSLHRIEDAESACHSVEDTTTSLTIQESRPEFVSATVERATKDTPLGIELVCENQNVIISSIAPDSLMSCTPVREGDHLLSINTKRCYCMDEKDVAQFLASLQGNITVVVHNSGGHASLVESMITKPSVDCRCGLGLASTGRHNVKITNVDSDGLFYDSLLNVGDRVVSINGIDCENIDAEDAGEIIKNSTKFVTVKAKTLLETGVVVAAFSCNNSAGSTIPPQLIAALEQQRQMQKTPSYSQLLGLFLAALAVILVLFMFWFL